MGLREGLLAEPADELQPLPRPREGYWRTSLWRESRRRVSPLLGVGGSTLHGDAGGAESLSAFLVCLCTSSRTVVALS